MMETEELVQLVDSLVALRIGHGPEITDTENIAVGLIKDRLSGADGVESITDTGGNVFADMGFGEKEAASLKEMAELTIEVEGLRELVEAIVIQDHGFPPTKEQSACYKAANEILKQHKDRIYAEAVSEQETSQTRAGPDKETLDALAGIVEQAGQFGEMLARIEKATGNPQAERMDALLNEIGEVVSGYKENPASLKDDSPGRRIEGIRVVTDEDIQAALKKKALISGGYAKGTMVDRNSPCMTCKHNRVDNADIELSPYAYCYLRKPGAGHGIWEATCKHDPALQDKFTPIE